MNSPGHNLLNTLFQECPQGLQTDSRFGSMQFHLFARLLINHRDYYILGLYEIDFILYETRCWTEMGIREC